MLSPAGGVSAEKARGLSATGVILIRNNVGDDSDTIENELDEKDCTGFLDAGRARLGGSSFLQLLCDQQFDEHAGDLRIELDA